jgi:protein involved in polysaccharide export with SLBB domain
MDTCPSRIDRRTRGNTVRLVLLALLLGTGPSGCAALTNPMADGVPLRLVPPELLAHSKADEQTIPLTLLERPRQAVYRLAAGDVLGVYIEGFLGDRTQPLPLHVAPHIRGREQLSLPPAAGYPVPVQEDGTIGLPAAGYLAVQGLTLPETRNAIRNVYVKKQLLRPENERIMVTLLYPRREQVLVFRQETPTFVLSSEGPLSGSRRGSGHLVDLPGNENDILHALAQTGGLPGLDAYNEIIVFHNWFRDEAGGTLLRDQLNGTATPSKVLQAHGPGALVTHIPLRQPVGQAPCVAPQDVVLRTGDVVFLEARDTELFYTGGLLPPGMHTLPRDRDLDVLEAVTLVRGPLFNGAFGGSNLSGNLIAPGIGNPSPSLLTVLRRVPDGRQVPIVVDLRQATRDSRERLIVRPGDLLVLQETPGEAITRYVSQTFLNVDIFWRALRGSNISGVVDVAGPDRVFNQPAVVSFPP